MDDWAQPKFGQSDIDSAGKILRNRGQGIFDEKAEWALSVLDNWRSSHAFPLNSVQVVLRRKAKEVEKNPFIAQRLKRTSSILKKLDKQSSMRLSQMQDIGGCRAVMKSVKSATRLMNLYLTRPSNFKLYKSKNYIEEPRDSGYRGIHLIYDYMSGRSDSKAVYNGLHVEIQIRSQLQHAWATAVETVGTLLGEALKSSEGPTEWLNLLKHISSLFAYAEQTPPVPGTPKKMELTKFIRSETTRLKIADRLRRFRDSLKIIESRRTRESRYFLLNLNAKAESLQVNSFRESEIEFATEAYIKQEKDALVGTGSDIVLVRADSIDSLKRSYPNYYADTEFFLESVKELIS